MPLEFTDQPPAAQRAAGATAQARNDELRQVAAELKAAAKKGNDPTEPDLVCSKWAIVAKDVRSPEKFYPLRTMSCEVRVVNKGTAPSLRDPNVQVVTSWVYVRYVQGYKHTPRQTGGAAAG